MEKLKCRERGLAPALCWLNDYVHYLLRGLCYFYRLRHAPSQSRMLVFPPITATRLFIVVLEVGLLLLLARKRLDHLFSIGPVGAVLIARLDRPISVSIVAIILPRVAVSATLVVVLTSLAALLATVPIVP